MIGDDNDLRRKSLLSQMSDEPLSAPGVSTPPPGIDPLFSNGLPRGFDPSAGPTVPGLSPSAGAAPAGGPSSADLVGGFSRRGGGTGGVAGGAALGGLAGAKLGSAVPGIGNIVGGLGGALLGGIGGAINKHAASAPTDFGVDDARKAIRAKLDETGGPEDVDSILKGQGWKPGDRYVGETGLQGVFKNLDENAAKRKAGAAAPPPTGGPITGADVKQAMTGGSTIQLDPSSVPIGNDMPDLPGGPVSLQTAGAGGGPDSVFSQNYSAGSNINNSGKNKFTRFKAALGHDPSDDEIRQFVAAHPDEWEDTTSPGGEYVFRQKQDFLNDPNNLDSKTGATSIWQNRNFVNAAGSGAGYAPPYEEHQAELPQGGAAGMASQLDPSLAGDPMARIKAALATFTKGGNGPNLDALLKQLGAA